jgi:hypothetical protein
MKIVQERLKSICRNIKAIVFLISFFRLFFCTSEVNAQQDTITYSVETPDSTDPRYDQLYKMFLADKTKETKQLWKVNLVSLASLTPNLNYERKIGNCFSSITGLSLRFLKANGRIYLADNTDYYKTLYFSSSFSQGFRYYYNLKRRNKLAKRTTGFSGNFFEIEYLLSYSTLFIFDDKAINPYEKYKNTLYLKYGFQRRIGNIGFIEPAIGIGPTLLAKRNPTTNVFQNEIYPSIKVKCKIGFAIDSFNNLKSLRIK